MLERYPSTQTLIRLASPYHAVFRIPYAHRRDPSHPPITLAESLLITCAKLPAILTNGLARVTIEFAPFVVHDLIPLQGTREYCSVFTILLLPFS